MRSATTIPAFLLAVACSSPTEAPQPRPERSSLLATNGELRGVALVESVDGPWIVRNVASGAAEGEGPLVFPRPKKPTCQ